MNNSKWTFWRVFWILLMLAEFYLAVQVALSDQKGEAALVMIVINIFAVPVVLFLVALRGLVRWVQSRKSKHS